MLAEIHTAMAIRGRPMVLVGTIESPFEDNSKGNRFMNTNTTNHTATTATTNAAAPVEWETIGYMTAARGQVLATVTWSRQRQPANAAPQKLRAGMGFDRVLVTVADGRSVLFEARGLHSAAAQVVFEERLKLLDTQGFSVDFSVSEPDFDLERTFQ